MEHQQPSTKPVHQSLRLSCFWRATPASALACGGCSEAGRSYVDGTAATKLISAPRLTRVPMNVYISPATYLLIRTNIGGMREDYRWLAPTRANRDLFKIHAPAGFRRVKDASAPSDGP